MNSLDSFRKPPCGNTMGIEIETVTEEYIERGYRGFFYVTSDGSIRPTNYNHYGVEFVSQPLTPPHLKREIDKLFKGLADAYPNKSCGVHIHVSRKWISTEKAKLIKKFIQSFTDEEKVYFFGRVGNNYCKYTESYDGDRYQCINLSRDNTVEFRMFKSGDAKWCKYCVDCVQYLITHAKHLNKEAFYAFLDMSA